MEDYKIFLDDIRNPEACLCLKTEYMPEKRDIYLNKSWKIARSYKEFVEIIEDEFKSNRAPCLISFDHDLADVDPVENSQRSQFSQEKTGETCAKFVVNFCIENNLNLPDYYIHSSNPVGRKRIDEAMRDYYRYKKLENQSK